jgi:hypothetical protein
MIAWFLSTGPLWVMTLLCVAQAGISLYMGQVSLSIVMAGYAIADIGLIYGVTK